MTSELNEKLAALEGQITTVEGEHLQSLAAACPLGTSIIEIGSYVGKSAAWLASGSRAGTGEHLFCIDLWGLPNAEGGWDLSASTYQLEAMRTFERVMSDLGYSDLVTAVRATSKHAARVWRRPIGLLHIDAEHTFSGLHTDYTSWSQGVVPGGVLVMHDYQAIFPDLTRCMDEVIIASGLWEEPCVVDRMLSLRRRSER